MNITDPLGWMQKTNSVCVLNFFPSRQFKPINADFHCCFRRDRTTWKPSWVTIRPVTPTQHEASRTPPIWPLMWVFERQEEGSGWFDTGLWTCLNSPESATQSHSITQPADIHCYKQIFCYHLYYWNCYPFLLFLLLFSLLLSQKGWVGWCRFLPAGVVISHFFVTCRSKEWLGFYFLKRIFIILSFFRELSHTMSPVVTCILFLFTSKYKHDVCVCVRWRVVMNNDNNVFYINKKF